MKEERVKDIFFVLYLLIILALVFVYFSIPERTALLSNVIEWWLSALNMVF